MIKNFQILKDNGDGTIDVEAPVFKKFTLPHPTDIHGNKLSGAAFAFMVNKWLSENAPSDNTVVDASAAAFVEAYAVDAVDDAPLDPELLGVSSTNFPVPYAG